MPVRGEVPIEQGATLHGPEYELGLVDPELVEVVSKEFHHLGRHADDPVGRRRLWWSEDGTDVSVECERPFDPDGRLREVEVCSRETGELAEPQAGGCGQPNER